MSYTPVIIATTDYPDIRLALGLSGTDTTTIADATVESRSYLPQVEVTVTAKITTYATILAAGGNQAWALKQGVVLGTAARLAQYYLAGKAAEEVERSTVGPYTTQYRKGPDWMALAEQLARDAVEWIERADNWGNSPRRITLVGRTGPTRRQEDGEREMSLFDWQELMLPPRVKGHMYDDEDDT